MGDGAVPEATDEKVVSMIAADHPDAFLYLGDVYESGTAEEFSQNYDPSYGRLKSITHPTPGNHEWPNRATGYFPYWDSTIHGAEYYSFGLGGWHFLSLNSEADHGDGSAQVAWLRKKLGRYRGTCNIAFMHRPRYSAGLHGNAKDMDPLVRPLRGHAAIVLFGHDHNYQRLDVGHGAWHFIVGTGGNTLYDVDEGFPGLAASSDTKFGALRLDLGRRQAEFQFRAVGGKILDRGRVRCRG